MLEENPVPKVNGYQYLNYCIKIIYSKIEKMGFKSILETSRERGKGSCVCVCVFHYLEEEKFCRPFP